MLLTQTNRLHLSAEETQTLRTLCRLSKNLYNVGVYTVRQYFFTEHKHLRSQSKSDLLILSPFMRKLYVQLSKGKSVFPRKSQRHSRYGMASGVCHVSEVED